MKINLEDLVGMSEADFWIDVGCNKNRLFFWLCIRLGRDSNVEERALFGTA